jgi:hypothetical protein
MKKTKNAHRILVEKTFAKYQPGTQGGDGKTILIFI